MADERLALMAHLLRRAGFGASREELEAYAARPYEEVVEELVNPERMPDLDEDLLRAVLPAPGRQHRQPELLERPLDLADGQHAAPARREDGAVLAPRVRDRLDQERAHPDDGPRTSRCCAGTAWRTSAPSCSTSRATRP